MVTNPEVIAVLNQIADQHGGLVRPEDVVLAASDERSALHSWFDWDDSEAAHKWRIEQARRLLRVTISYIAGPDNPSTRVFVSLSGDREEGGYRSTVAVMSNADYRRQLLADALAELQSFEKKYAALKELASVFAAIRKINQHDRRGRSVRKVTTTGTSSKVARAK